MFLVVWFYVVLGNGVCCLLNWSVFIIICIILDNWLM